MELEQTLFDIVCPATTPVLTVDQVLSMSAYADRAARNMIARGEKPVRIPAEMIKPAIPLR